MCKWDQCIRIDTCVLANLPDRTLTRIEARKGLPLMPIIFGRCYRASGCVPCGGRYIRSWCRHARQRPPATIQTAAEGNGQLMSSRAHQLVCLNENMRKQQAIGRGRQSAALFVSSQHYEYLEICISTSQAALSFLSSCGSMHFCLLTCTARSVLTLSFNPYSGSWPSLGHTPRTAGAVRNDQLCLLWQMR